MLTVTYRPMKFHRRLQCFLAGLGLGILHVLSLFLALVLLGFPWNIIVGILLGILAWFVLGKQGIVIGALLGLACGIPRLLKDLKRKAHNSLGPRSKFRDCLEGRLQVLHCRPEAVLEVEWNAEWKGKPLHRQGFFVDVGSSIIVWLNYYEDTFIDDAQNFIFPNEEFDILKYPRDDTYLTIECKGKLLASKKAQWQYSKVIDDLLNTTYLLVFDGHLDSVQDDLLRLSKTFDGRWNCNQSLKTSGGCYSEVV